MLKTALALALSLAAFAAQAETFEIKMLNRSDKGPMVFEPDFVAIQPGDTVKFVIGHKSHNAASIDGMVPDGYEGFKGKINEEIAVRFDTSGFYGIKCSPHIGMGMVMVIKVGEAEMSEAFRTVEVPARARKRFDAIFAAIDAGAAKN